MPDWWSASLAAFREVLAIAALRRVLGGWLAFNAAEWAIWVAILVYAYAATGPASVGLVAVAQLVPAALAAPRTARLAERMGPGRALPSAYLVIGLGMLITGIAMAVGAPPLLVYIGAAFVVVAYTAVRPLQIAILPSLVGRAEQLTAANALTSILEGAGVLLGPLLCGILVAVASPAVVYVAGGAATLLAAVLVRGVVTGGADQARGPVLERPSVPAAALALTTSTDHAPNDVAPNDVASDGDQGWRAVTAAPSRLLAIVTLAARFGVAAAMDVLLVLAAIELLGMGAAGAGYLSAAIGLGWVLGGAVTLAVVGRPRLTPLLVVGAAIWAVPILVVALVVEPAAALLALVGAGVGLAVVDVAVRTVLQRLVDPAQLAGVFGIAEGASMAGAATGALLAGVLVATFGVTAAIVAAGLILPAVAIVATPTVGRGEAAVRIPFREIALLRRIPLFAPVPAPALETAAAALVAVPMISGQAVLREGDVGDRFYVVDAGEVTVDRHGTMVATLGPGGSFGELALIRDIPRTASVTATTDGSLLALDRAPFLLAITASPRAAAEAMRVASRRLELDAAAPVPDLRS